MGAAQPGNNRRAPADVLRAVPEDVGYGRSVPRDLLRFHPDLVRETDHPVPSVMPGRSVTERY
jgi:hypothetical protein